MIRQLFSNYIKSNNKDKSGKASSYIRALDLLGDMLDKKPLGFPDCSKIWEMRSPDRLKELFEIVREQTNRAEESEWVSSEQPASYLVKGFCSAALNSYIIFSKKIAFSHGQKSIKNWLKN